MGDESGEDDAACLPSRQVYRECLVGLRRGQTEMEAFLETWFAHQEQMLAKAHKEAPGASEASGSADCAASYSKVSSGGSIATRTPILPAQPNDPAERWCCVVQETPASPQDAEQQPLEMDPIVIAPRSRNSTESYKSQGRSRASAESRASSASASGNVRKVSTTSGSEGIRSQTSMWSRFTWRTLPTLMIPGNDRASNISNSSRSSARSSGTTHMARAAGMSDTFSSGTPEEFTQEKTLMKKAYDAVCAARISRTHSLQGDESGTFQRRRLRRLPALVASAHFEYAIAAMIFSSSIAVGWEVEFVAQAAASSNYADRPKLPVAFEVTQVVFCVIFALELVIRAAGQGIWQFFTKRVERVWNYYDLIIVVSSILELIVSTHVDDPGSSSLLVTARIFRISRIVRIIRFMPFIGKELRQMVYSMFFTMKSLVSACLLIFIVFYVFGIIFTQGTIDYLLGDDDRRHALYFDPLIDNFGSVSTTIYTLFLSISGGVTWGEPVRNLFYVGTWYVGLFVLFISFTLFAFLNVITGFFVDKAFDIAKIDKDTVIQDQLKHSEAYSREFQKIFFDIDTDDSGDITIDELIAGSQKTEVRDYMRTLDIDVEKAWELFRLLDDNGDGRLSIQEFVGGCLKLRGQAKTTDIAGVRKDVKDLSKALAKVTSYIHEAFDQLGVSGIAVKSNFASRNPSRSPSGAPGGMPPGSGKHGLTESPTDPRKTAPAVLRNTLEPGKPPPRKTT